MRKIKECIVDCIDGPACFAMFLRNVAQLLVVDSVQRLWRDEPDVEIAGEKQSGKRKNDITFTDIISVLNSDDFLRGTGQFCQLNGFMAWFMGQNEPDDQTDDPVCWYDREYIVDKWNEYAEERKCETT